MTGPLGQIGKALRLLVQPLEPERARALDERWMSLDPRWRTPYQAFGSKMTGCAATTGLHPRCDFSCTGCYLGDEANQVAPFPLAEVLAQLERVRAWTGPKGNIQITDGEVTLRPESELIAVLRHARALDLIPMVMTHGDTFRKRPALLRRLMLEGDLTEVSIHVDVTMRGRLGYRNALIEEDLQPLREEFAAMIRAVNRETGRDLRAATTMTVTRENLAGVAHVARWCAQNRDAFRMLSLQPVADVGRTRQDLGAVSVDELWAEVARGLAPFGAEVGDGGPIHVGHPACNRIASFLCFERRGAGPGAVANGSPGTVVAGSPGTVANGSPGTVAAGSPGTVANGSPGTVAAGSPGTVMTGSPGAIASGSPGPSNAAPGPSQGPPGRASEEASCAGDGGSGSAGGSTRFVKTIRAGTEEDREFLEGLRTTGLMGVGYRDDGALAGLARKAGAIVRGLPFILGPGLRFARRRMREAGISLPAAALGILGRRLRVDGFSVVSHHFMSRSEVTTPLGQERLAACVFRLPVGERMVSMCEVNLLGAREEVYARGAAVTSGPLAGTPSAPTSTHRVTEDRVQPD